MSAGRIVWDDDFGGRPPQRKKSKPLPESDGFVRIRRETGSRGGKTVTTIRGIPLRDDQLQELAKELKKKCGVGGSAKDGVIEIQGDKRDQVEAFLIGKGYKVKRAGG